ncbi:probable serine/threonine-protein kinase nek3 [Eurosta solidaginis]|uniref:probable serine/threonine-protein kinase nek3 n=1 Tax=Eurosta solidaginis TaxID=178769 RepID=UPI003530E2F5
MSDFKMAVESLHEDNDLDALIADTSSLIASVYSILEQPRRSATTTTTPLLGRRSLNNSSESGQNRSNSSSPKSPKTPRLGLPSRIPLSTPSSREIDREINRIDRFCEMLEHNLRSVSDGQQTGHRLGSGSPPSTGSAVRSPMSTMSAGRNSAHQTMNNQHRSPTPEEVIDLCDSMYIPTQIRRPYSFNSSSSDDVVIVAPTDDDVVDLCTPPFQRNNVPRARNTYRRMLNTLGFGTNNHTNATTAAARQRLVPSRRTLASFSSHSSSEPTQSSSTDARSSCSSVSTATSTTNVAVGSTTPSVGQYNLQKPSQTNNAPGAHFENMNNSGTTTNSSGRVPFMCAVCMESCVNNQPTSTKCGHVYCSNCIRQAIRLTRKCPMCNTKVTANQLFRIYI